MAEELNIHQNFNSEYNQVLWIELTTHLFPKKKIKFSDFNIIENFIGELSAKEHYNLVNNCKLKFNFFNYFAFKNCLNKSVMTNVI